MILNFYRKRYINSRAVIKIATEIYGADGVDWSQKAEDKLSFMRKMLKHRN